MTILLESVESKVLRLERENAELRRINAEQTQSISEQACRINDLLLRIEELRSEVESLKKNSRNSSKPPSSDIVKAPLDKLSRQTKRKIDAQPGRPQHLHTLFPSSQVDEVTTHELTVCPKCQGTLVATTNVQKFQQVQLVDKPIFVTEHQQQEYWCDHCQQFHTAPLPSTVRKEGFFHSNLTALVGYLKGVMARWSSTWYGMLGPDFTKMFYAMHAMTRYLSANVNYKARPGSIMTTQSLTNSSTCSIGYANLSYSFSTTIGNTYELFTFDALGLPNNVAQAINKLAEALPRSEEEFGTEASIHNVNQALDWFYV
jgi:hypothetical protein